MQRNWGMVLLALLLIIVGAIEVLHLNFEAMPIILGIMAIASGILLLIGK
jgi:uncharacterized membrane protein HdeD (DUF308 family)